VPYNNRNARKPLKAARAANDNSISPATGLLEHTSAISNPRKIADARYGA